MPPVDPFERTIHFSVDPKDYCGFFDHARVKTLLASASQPICDGVLLQILSDWQCASNAFRMPSINLLSIQGFYNGYVRYQPTSKDRYLSTMKKFFTARLQHRIGNRKTAELMDEITTITEMTARDFEAMKPINVTDEYWAQSLALKDFGMSLWSLQNLAFSTLYYGYESGIRKLLSTKSGKKPNHWKGKDDLPAAMDLYLWTGAGAVLFTDTVDSARLIRNAIAHSSSKADDKIKKSSVVLCKIVDETLNVLPEHIRQLHEHLFERLELIAAKVR